MEVRIRQSSSGSSTNQFLNLIADPFQSQVQTNSIYAAIIWSFVVSGALFLLFCWLRPRNSRVYAPRAKHADDKHAPIALQRGFFGWVSAVKDVPEQELVDKIGLDAVIFLRFLRMIRNMFGVLTVFGCGILIPVNLVGGSAFYEQYNSIATLLKLTPQYIFGTKFWAFVVCSYLFQATICAFIWYNYTKVYALRRAYFNSKEYQSSLHSRTLLLTHIPESSRTDAGIAELVESVAQTHEVPRAAIGRNVKDLPELIDSHDEAVRKLESLLAKYLKDHRKLPAKRPTCKPARDDRAILGSEKIDAIDYLTDRVARLETTIQEVRESVDRRNPMPYGFASYTHIEDAHATAYTARAKGPAGCDVYLAPKPHDLLWQNLAMSRAIRKTRAFWDGTWMVMFTIAFIVPNLLTSIFLSDFSHLGLVWPAFQENLKAHPTGWGIVQGILAPLVQTLMYMGVPIVFRRLYTHSGDVSKTSRERHVTAKLYVFFVFNNVVVFSVFGSAWRFVASVMAAQDQGIWHAIKDNHLFSKIMTGLCNVSTFWLTWQMQRNLSAAIDIAQAWPLVWSYVQCKWFSPTPRQLIELSAPQPLMYADYYNAYLQVVVVGLCFGTLQPIILPVTAFYLGIEVWLKKYLVQYVFITKTESGGRFWRLLVNRLLCSVLLSNAVIALIVGAQGVGSIDSVRNGNMLYAMIPLPFLLAAFKWFCQRTFDDKLHYYSIQPFTDVEDSSTSGTPDRKRNDRISVRFGHPALYKKLLTPMVHARLQHLLKEIYGDRPTGRHDIFEAPHRRSTDRAMPNMPAGHHQYGDMYMTEMNPADPGMSLSKVESTHGMPKLEMVAEQDLDFEHFKRRAEFREQFGGDGELYGRPEDLAGTIGGGSSRPGTPSTFATFADRSELGYGASVSRDKRGSETPPTAEEKRRGSSATRMGTTRAEGVNTQYSPVRNIDVETMDEHVRRKPVPGGDYFGGEGTTYARGYQRTPVRNTFHHHHSDGASVTGEAEDEGEGMDHVGLDVDIPVTPFGEDQAMLRQMGQGQGLGQELGRGRGEDTGYERYRRFVR